VAAHLDHGMRPGSADDARWVAGLCRAWQVPLISRRLSEAPGDEASARAARYGFLSRASEESEADAILTAHHADDQAETVLFRVVRGTGLRGLGGIAPARGRLHRPLLSRTRRELEAYARRNRLSWRRDPTNRSMAHARNRIRHEVIPVLETVLGRDVRPSLARLARNARRAEEESAALEAVAFREVLRGGPGRMEWPVDVVSRWPVALRRRLLRRAAERLGGYPSEAATAGAVDAMGALTPGQGVDLGGGLRLERRAGTWTLRAPEDAEVAIGSPRGEPDHG